MPLTNIENRCNRQMPPIKHTQMHTLIANAHTYVYMEDVKSGCHIPSTCRVRNKTRNIMIEYGVSNVNDLVDILSENSPNPNSVSSPDFSAFESRLLVLETSQKRALDGISRIENVLSDLTSGLR